jgi:hypothetical protein
MEQFLLGNLSKNRLERVEDHLLLCSQCIDQAEALAVVLQFLQRETGRPNRDRWQPTASRIQWFRWVVFTFPPSSHTR